jgi:hypothetical protein
MGRLLTIRQEYLEAPVSDRLAFVLACTIAFLSLLFGIAGYPIIGHDAYVHLNWIDQFTRLRAEGAAYPRWLPDSFGGFGAPVFYFYPPLTYWLASAIQSIGVHSASTIFHVLQLTASVAAVATSCRFFSIYTDSTLRRLTASLLYAFAAYHFCDVYTRNALGEHVALLFLPVVLTERPGGDARAIALLTIGWAGLLLTNIPVTIIAAILAGTLLVANRDVRKLRNQVFAVLLAALIAAVYLLPAQALHSLIQTEHLHDLFASNPYGYSILNLLQRKIDWLRVISLIILLTSIVVVVRSRKNTTKDWMFGIAILAILLQIPFVGDLFWRFVPGLDLLQYAWRFTIVLQLYLLFVYVKREVPASSCIAIGLAIVTLLPVLTLSRNFFSRPPSAVTAYRMDAPEYGTRWTGHDPFELIALTQRRMNEPSALLLGLTDPHDSVTLISRSSNRWAFHANLTQNTPVRFHQLYWPYWSATAGQHALPLTCDPSGFLVAQLPAGEYRIDLQLEPSEYERVGAILSGIGAALLILLLLVVARQQFRTQ